MLAQVIVLAWGLAMRGPATPAGAPSAESCGDRVAPCAPDSIRAAAVRQARTATRDGAWNDAAELWQDALILDGRRGADWLALGDVLVRADRYREAAAAYQRAIQVDARLTEAGTRGVARAYARMGDDRQAVRWLELALRAGVSPDEVWSEDTFGVYRNDPRLRVPERVQVRGRGTPNEGHSTA